MKFRVLGFHHPVNNLKNGKISCYRAAALSFWIYNKILFLRQRKEDNFCNNYLEKLLSSLLQILKQSGGYFFLKNQGIIIRFPTTDHLLLPHMMTMS